MSNNDPLTPFTPSPDSEAIRAHWAAKDAAREKSRKSSNSFMLAGAAIGVIGLLLLIVGANSTDAYGQHIPPSPGAVLIFVVAVLLVLIGFARRLLAAVENRNR